MADQGLLHLTNDRVYRGVLCGIFWRGRVEQTGENLEIHFYSLDKGRRPRVINSAYKSATAQHHALNK